MDGIRSTNSRLRLDRQVSDPAPAGVLTYGDDKTPYTWSYNFTITQRVPWNSVVEMQYSGNRSRDLLLDSALSNQNLIPAGAFFKPDPITGVINDP